MVHPLDLPEIRSHLAACLTRHELTICSRVSRDWNATFEPLLWRELRVVNNAGPGSRPVSKESLQEHAGFIRSLSFSDDDSGTFKDLTCPNLEDVFLHRADTNNRNFVHRHRESIRELTISSEDGMNWGMFWNDTKAFQSLKSLAFSSGRVCMEEWPAFLGVWTSLTYLELTGVHFWAGSRIKTSSAGQVVDASCFKGSVITRIKELRLSYITGLESAGNELAILQYFPDLEKLSFRRELFSTTQNLSHLSHRLAEYANYCPKLGDISLFVPGSDDAIYDFLKDRLGVPLKGLTLHKQWFGQAAWRLVQTHHWSTIRVLKTRDSASISGKMVQCMMCSLPNLDILHVPWILDQDIYSDNRPWICRGLTELALCFALVTQDTAVAQKMMHRRLATLNLDILGNNKCTTQIRPY